MGVVGLGFWVALVSGGGDATAVRGAVRSAVGAASEQAGRNPAMLEIALDSTGGIKAIHLARSGGSRAWDREIMAALVSTARLGSGTSQCGIAVWARSRVAVACMNSDAISVAGDSLDDLEGAVGRLFMGWWASASGSQSKALYSLRSATEQDPDWVVASVALGQELSRQGRDDEAEPYLAMAGITLLRAGSLSIGVQAEEPQPVKKSMIPSKGIVEAGEGEVTVCQRENSETLAFVQARMAALSDCVDSEIQRSKDRVMAHNVPVMFVVTPAGAVIDIVVEHRFYKESELATCVKASLKGSMKPVGGTNCPGAFSLKIERIQYTE